MDSFSLKTLEKYRLIAVIRCNDFPLGIKMAKAMAKAKISLIEITWNSIKPHTLISQLRQELPHCYIGAGTILNEANLHQAIDAGAQFIFSPHVNLKLIEIAKAANIFIIPGALSPTEILTAYQAGAEVVKVYPIQCMGGVNYIINLQGPLGHIPLIPTGGVNFDNALDFLNKGAIAVGMSNAFFPPDLILKEDFETITLRASRFQQQLSSVFRC
jgi:2-dehydro-3-deoxyphosphogluconate aldolase/(4S)-4-hydroxy-2-oxoglutarate aldolase